MQAPRICVAVVVCGLAAAAQPSGPGTAARQYFTDVALLDQDGVERRFFTDLMQGKTVIIIPFFTTCTGVCPPMNRNLEKIQDWLGERQGKDVHLLSVSVDPVNDTVPRLKDYSQRYHAKPGWYFLGGPKESVQVALKKLGQYVEVREDHTNIMIIGNLRTGLWKKAFALAPIQDLIKIVDSVVNDPGQ